MRGRHERLWTRNQLTLILLSSRQSVFCGSRFTKQIWERGKEKKKCKKEGIGVKVWHITFWIKWQSTSRVESKGKITALLFPLPFLWPKFCHSDKTISPPWVTVVCCFWITTVQRCLSLAKATLRRLCLSVASSPVLTPSWGLYLPLLLPHMPLPQAAGLMVCDGVLMSVLGVGDCLTAAVWFSSTKPLM